MTEMWTDLKATIQSLTVPYTGVLNTTTECRTIPDCPLTGSGACTVAMEAEDGCLTYFITRTDFWVNDVQEGGENGRGFPHYKINPAPIGRLRIRCDGEATSAIHTQDMSTASIRSVFPVAGGTLTSTLVPLAQEDRIIVALRATADTDVCIELEASQHNRLCVTMEGVQDGSLWCAKELTSVLISNACIAAAVLGADAVDIAADAALKPYLRVTVRAGEEAHLVLAVKSNKDDYQHRDQALAAVAEFAAADIAPALAAHRQWWQDFWLRSTVNLDDHELMRFYYGATYALGCCCEISGRTPPGLAGGWVQNDAPIWGGNYTMNYNGEAPFWGLISSNRQQLGMPYVRMINDFIPRGRILARELKTKGIVMPVMIEPWGHTDHPDALYQKSNASLAAVYLVNYYDHTHDHAFMREYLYPYLLELTAFWEDNLVLLDGRYTIQDSTARERLPGDLNPGPELGYVRMVFAAALTGSEVLGIDLGKRAQWQDYLARLSDYPTTCENGSPMFKETENRREVAMHGLHDNPVCLDHVYPGEAACTPAYQLLTRNTLDYLDSWKQENAFPRIFSQAVRGKYEPEAILGHLKARFTLGPAPFETLRNNCTISPKVHGIEAVGAIEAVNAMLVRDNGDGIEIFNNWPRQRNAAFTQLRTKGAFLVSARLEAAVVVDVAIISEQGQECAIYNPWPDSEVTVTGADGSTQRLRGVTLRWTTLAGGRYQLQPSTALYHLDGDQLTAMADGALDLRSRTPGSGTKVLHGDQVVAESREQIVSFPVQAGRVYTIRESPLPLLATVQIDEACRSVPADCQNTLDILFDTLDDACRLRHHLHLSDGSVAEQPDSVCYTLNSTDVVEITPDHVVRPLAAGKCEIRYTISSHGVELRGTLLAQVMSRKVVRNVTATTEGETQSWGRPMHTPECAVEGDGMSGADVTDTQRPNPYGTGLFGTQLSPGAETLLTFDLKRELELDQMWVWNYHCPDDNYRRLWWHGGSAVGIRDVRVYTSLDGKTWTELDNAGKPFRFARASGEDRCMAATNLVGDNLPVCFHSVKARYVKLVPDLRPCVGNWGAKTFGVSQVRFTEKQ